MSKDVKNIFLIENKFLKNRFKIIKEIRLIN